MNNKYNSNLAFVDLLFNLILGFVFLFIVSFLMINEPDKKSEVEQKAEFMIVLDWDDDKDVDMDLWVQTPNGKVGFANPSEGSVFLDKDDLGFRNDTYTLENGEMKTVPVNREIVNIRAFESGEYIVNAHLYGGRFISGPTTSSGSKSAGVIGNKLTEYLNVKLNIYKLNPYSVVYSGEKIFTTIRKEKTFTRFTIQDNGMFSNVNNLPKKIVSAFNP